MLSRVQQTNPYEPGIGVGNRICQGLLANAVQRFKQGQRKFSRFPGAMYLHLHVAAADHALRAKRERRDEIARFQRFGPKGSYAAPCLLMTVTHQVGREVELLMKDSKLFRGAPAYRLKLEPNSCKALSQGVVHFLRESLAFVEDGTEFPALRPVVQEGDRCSECKHARGNSKEVRRVPPWGPGHNRQVLRGTEQQNKGRQIMRVRAPHHGHTTQPKHATDLKILP